MFYHATRRLCPASRTLFLRRSYGSGVAALTILSGESEVLVGAKSTIHAIDGRAADVTGTVDVDAGTRLVGGRIEVPIAALKSGNPLYDVELQRRVDARRYPTIVGEVRTATALGDDGLFRVEGDVLFHGVTRGVEGKVLVRSDGHRVRIEGEHVFDVREFGIKPPRILALRVEPTVKVRLRLVAEPA